MEFAKRTTKILIKDDSGRIVQVIPETDANAVYLDGNPLVEVIETLEEEKADKEHRHIIDDVDDLQTSLDEKNPLIDEISSEEVLALLET
jgi:hypothetical protein